MNTRPVPVIIMLTAGFVTCISGIVQHFSFGTYIKTLLLVLVGFYLVGCIIRLILDKGFRLMDDSVNEYASMELGGDIMDDLALTDDDYIDEYQDM